MKRDLTAPTNAPTNPVAQELAEKVREACAKKRDTVPVLPGDMPEAMWQALNGDRDAVTQAMRIAAIQTLEEYEQAIRSLDLSPFTQATGAGLPERPTTWGWAGHTYVRLEDYDALRAAALALQSENAQWRTWGIIEIAIRNPSVSEYMRHWEGRTEKAEQRADNLQRELEAARACIRGAITLGAINPNFTLIDDGAPGTFQDAWRDAWRDKHAPAINSARSERGGGEAQS